MDALPALRGTAATTAALALYARRHLERHRRVSDPEMVIMSLRRGMVSAEIAGRGLRAVMKHRAAASLLSVLACTLVWGPERFPLGAGMHTEIRVRLCAGYSGSYLSIGSRTYERTLHGDGSYTTTVLSTGENGWSETSIPLYVTGQEPKP